MIMFLVPNFLLLKKCLASLAPWLCMNLAFLFKLLSIIFFHFCKYLFFSSIRVPSPHPSSAKTTQPFFLTILIISFLPILNFICSKGHRQLKVAFAAEGILFFDWLSHSIVVISKVEAHVFFLSAMLNFSLASS